jgi:hypothetical protein
MLRGPTRPLPEPEHARGQRSSESRSGRRARRSGASGDGSAGSRGARSSGCASSRGSPPPGPRSTRRRARRRRREAMGAGLPPRGGSLRPLAQSRGGGGGNDAWGGRRSDCLQATHGRGNARRGDDWGCSGCRTGGGNNVRRAPEEKEARVFHPEVGDYFPLIVFFSQLGPNSLAFAFTGWRPPCPPLAPAKVLRTDAVVSTRWHSSSFWS